MTIPFDYVKFMMDDGADEQQFLMELNWFDPHG